MSAVASTINTYNKLQEIVLPDSLAEIKANAFINGGNKYCIISIPNSVSAIDNPRYIAAGANNGYRHMDFGNTRTSVPTVNRATGVDTNCKYYVPDALYDTWIAASGWNEISAKIHRHSELEAPYLYSSKVAGGAETGTTGTPAAITAVKSVYESDWATLSATAVSSTFYVVLPDPVFPTRVKYTAASGLPDWEGDIDGVIQGGGDEEATTQIPNVFSAEEVLIGSNVTGLNDYAFMYCSSLKSVAIGNGVTSIDGAALAETGLSSITIPSNVTTIGFNVFKNCKALTSVTFEGFTKNEVKDMTTGEDKIFGDCFTDNGEPIEKSFTAVCSDGSMTIHFSADWEATITFTDL